MTTSLKNILRSNRSSKILAKTRKKKPSLKMNLNLIPLPTTKETLATTLLPLTNKPPLLLKVLILAQMKATNRT